MKPAIIHGSSPLSCTTFCGVRLFDVPRKGETKTMRTVSLRDITVTTEKGRTTCKSCAKALA